MAARPAVQILANRERKRLSASGQVAVPDNRVGTTKFTWKDFASVALIRRHNIRISVEGKVYKGTIREQDYESLKGLLVDRLGEKLVVREDIF